MAGPVRLYTPLLDILISAEAIVDWRSRITVDPKVLVGKPMLRRSRLAVGFVLELKANGLLAPL